MADCYLSCSDCVFFDYDVESVPCSACFDDEMYPSCFLSKKCNCDCDISLPKREWSTGAKRDPNEGKGRMDLLPWSAILEVSKHCQKGAEHYGEHNVDKGIPLSSLCDSGARHLAKFIDGWDDEDHLLAAAWNILWALQMRLKKPDMIDIPWKENN